MNIQGGAERRMRAARPTVSSIRKIVERAPLTRRCAPPSPGGRGTDSKHLLAVGMRCGIKPLPSLLSIRLNCFFELAGIFEPLHVANRLFLFQKKLGVVETSSGAVIGRTSGRLFIIRLGHNLVRSPDVLDDAPLISRFVVVVNQ